MTKPLRLWRSEQLLSTRRLASEAGTSNKTIVQIENGRQTPTFATIEKITRVLRVDPREVTEFALALAERARESIDTVPVPANAPETHVVCVSALPSFLTLARRLLAEERYAVTSMIGVSPTADQVAGLRPSLVLLDLGAEPSQMLELVRHLRATPATLQLPIVVTGRDRHRLEERIAALDDSVRGSVALVPFDRDQRTLLAEVALRTGSADDVNDE